MVKTDFPVRINVELITETPNGPNDLCVAEAKNVTYKIKNTNGSVYEWIAEGGDVVSGQGTNNVTVNWKKGLTNYRFWKPAQPSIPFVSVSRNR